MRAELLPRAKVRAFAEKMQVVVRQHLSELIWIGDLPRAALLLDAESICKVGRPAIERQASLEQPIGMAARHRRDLVVDDQIDGRCHRLHRPHDDGRTLVDRDDVTAEDGERIGARTGRDLGNGAILGCVKQAGHEKIVSRRMVDRR